MTITLNLFLLAFILIEIPILFLLVYLFRKRKENGRPGQMRDVIFVIALGFFIFILGMIILVLASMFKGLFTPGFITGMFAVTTSIVLISFWYAFFKIKQLL